MSTDANSSTPTPLTTFHKPRDEGVGLDETWINIKHDYEGSSVSVRTLAAKYDINRNKINEKRKLENWTKYVPIGSRAKNATAHTTQDTTILGSIALRKIKEVKIELGKHYSHVDEPLILIFSKNYERYIQLELTLATEGIVIESAKTGGRYLNPTFTALQAVQKTILTYANQLGLSMASRKLLGIKLGADGKSEMSLFDIADDINKMEVEI